MFALNAIIVYKYKKLRVVTHLIYSLLVMGSEAQQFGVIKNNVKILTLPSLTIN